MKKIDYMNETFSKCLEAVKGLGDAFEMAAKALRGNKLSKAISDANKYIEEPRR